VPDEDHDLNALVEVDQLEQVHLPSQIGTLPYDQDWTKNLLLNKSKRLFVVPLIGPVRILGMVNEFRPLQYH